MQNLNIYCSMNVAISADQPRCPNCGRPCTHQRQDGTYHDYCGKTCRDDHLRVKPTLIMPPIGKS